MRHFTPNLEFQGDDCVLTSDANGNVALLASAIGNVGIGTISPPERLEAVAGPSASATKLVIDNEEGFGPAAL